MLIEVIMKFLKKGLAYNMRIKENLLIYTFIGIVVYLVRTTSSTEILYLLNHIGISVAIGKIVETFSYNFSVKYKLSMKGSLIFSFFTVSIVVMIMLAAGLLEDAIFTMVISVVITICMTIVFYRREQLYNKKLENSKKELERDDSYEDN